MMNWMDCKIELVLLLYMLVVISCDGRLVESEIQIINSGWDFKAEMVLNM